MSGPRRVRFNSVGAGVRGWLQSPVGQPGAGLGHVAGADVLERLTSPGSPLDDLVVDDIAAAVDDIDEKRFAALLRQAAK